MKAFRQQSHPWSGSASRRRRVLLAGAAALPLAAFVDGRARAQAEPVVAAYEAFIGTRVPSRGRLVLDIPRLADNGNLVPVRIALPGPFAPGAEVRSIHLFSERNPVPQMAVFHFPVPVARVEVETRVRLAGTQRVAAVATLADGTLHAALADVSITVSACIEGV